jgi:hypothetical protein
MGSKAYLQPGSKAFRRTLEAAGKAHPDSNLRQRLLGDLAGNRPLGAGAPKPDSEAGQRALKKLQEAPDDSQAQRDALKTVIGYDHT